jgi:hypothetical protein
MPDVPICDGVIASAMTEEQSGADGVSQLTEFLTQKVKGAVQAMLVVRAQRNRV